MLSQNQFLAIFAIVIAISQGSLGFGFTFRSDGAEASERDLIFRALLCPNVPRDILAFYRFHLTTRKCYQAGTQGPCGSHMIFAKVPRAFAVGRCVCNDIEGTPDRPMVRHPETNNCYYVYRQGYCASNEWLVLDENNEGQCEPNACLDLETMRENEIYARELLPYGGGCVELGQPSDLCDMNQVIRFEGNFPTCVNLTSSNNEIFE